MARGPQDDDLPWLAEGVREERATLVPRARLVGGGLVAVLLAVLVALGVFLAAGRKSDGSAGYARPEDAPLIAADPGPYKVAPDNPGGAQITGIDDSVAAVASGSEQASAIAPDAPEEPLARPVPGSAPPVDLLPPAPAGAPPRASAPAPAATPATTVAPAPPAARVIAPAPVTPPLAKPAKPEASPARDAAAPPKPTKSDLAAKADAKSETAARPAKAADPLAPSRETGGKEIAAMEPAKAAAHGSVALQLGAFSTRDKADAAWTKAAGDGALAGLAKRIEPVERDGATLYRLRAGGVASADAAKALCARIRSAGNACIVAE